MGDCGGGCTMLWRNGRRSRDCFFLSRGGCMNVVNEQPSGVKSKHESLEPDPRGSR